ncbi:MAG: nitroreductase family protein [Victivallales bacterium]|jgi:nitroreductase
MNREFEKIIRARRSIRKFRPDPVPEKTILELIELASWAPSAGNRQDWFFSITRSPELIRKMADVVKDKWQKIISDNSSSGIIGDIADYSSNFSRFAEASVIIAVSAPAPASFEKQMLGDKAGATFGSFTSAAMAAQNLMLAAELHGFGTFCLTGPIAAESELKELLDIKRRHELVCLIALGYPDEEPKAPPRKNIESITRFL